MPVVFDDVHTHFLGIITITEYYLTSTAEEIKELWAEYENNSSIEANLVKDFDKVCIPLCLVEY